ncbi:MAG TPA: anti-sigma factor, partial [Clostridiales bacterium]|nr:anti-sigma factor [Clostridiales bacterium]
AFLIMIAGANSSMAFAAALSKIPVVGDIINVLTFREYRIDEKTYDSHIKVPEIKGLENKDLENSLNKKYLDEGKQLYEDFIADMGNLKENGGGHLGVHSGYTVVTDNDRILSISRYTVNTVASSSTTMKYDTIDKVNEVLVTLPSLFKDDSYVNIISENIKEQMVDENESDPNKVYWVKGIEQSSLIDLFEEISQDQNFYINSENKLVISFDKYEVAPGYMGIVEFVIPTEILSELLVGDAYIK